MSHDEEEALEETLVKGEAGPEVETLSSLTSRSADMAYRVVAHLGYREHAGEVGKYAA